MTKTPQLEIAGMPFVPGIVRGTLHHVAKQNVADHIVILQQQDIERVTESPLGFVVIEGAPFSHTMIRFMSMGKPTIIVSALQAKQLEEGMEVMLNGTTGWLSTNLSEVVEPEPDTRRLSTAAPLKTADGVTVHLRASVRTAMAAKHCRQAGAEAVGLVRSEFLLPHNDSIPDVAFYTDAFGQICEAATPLPVTIRLLDLAADKIPAWMPALDSVGGALGLQGVRLYGIEPMKQVYQAQLSAINNLSQQYDIRVLIPYLVRYEELNHFVNLIRQHLANSIPLGAMAETPASVLDMPNWFDLVDFVAIGCNDLMQCLFAADRDRPELRAYLDPYAPLLWRFMYQIASAAGVHLEKVQLCGVLAQLPGVLPLLLGLGYRAFSVEAVLLPHLQAIISTTKVVEAQQLVQKIRAMKNSHEVLHLLGLPAQGYQPFLLS